MANILLSVGLTSSLSISSTKSFFAGGSAKVISEPLRGYLCKPSELVIDRTNRLLNRFLKRPPDTHDLTDTLHAATKEAADATELLEIPTGYLNNNIV